MKNLLPLIMTMNEVFCNTFKAMRHELGQDGVRDMRPLWERRLSTASVFCRSLVACGYLTEEQMQRAAMRYRLGMSRDGGVIFWQIDEREMLRDGKIMSEVMPEYVWLATGGKTELSVAKLKPLAGRKVILFPDTDETGDTYRDWYEVAEAASDVFGHPVTVSSLLEQRATKAQKAAKIDIVDLIFE